MCPPLASRSALAPQAAPFCGGSGGRGRSSRGPVSELRHPVLCHLARAAGEVLRYPRGGRGQAPGPDGSWPHDHGAGPNRSDPNACPLPMSPVDRGHLGSHGSPSSSASTERRTRGPPPGGQSAVSDPGLCLSPVTLASGWLPRGGPRGTWRGPYEPLGLNSSGLGTRGLRSGSAPAPRSWGGHTRSDAPGAWQCVRIPEHKEGSSWAILCPGVHCGPGGAQGAVCGEPGRLPASRPQEELTEGPGATLFSSLQSHVCFVLFFKIGRNILHLK